MYLRKREIILARRSEMQEKMLNIGNGTHWGLFKQRLTVLNKLDECLIYGVKCQERTEILIKIEVK